MRIPYPRPRRASLARLIAILLVGISPQALASLFNEPYQADRNYASGTFTDDAFAGGSVSPNRTYIGRKVVRFNGDVVVAALVKHPTGNQSNNYWNLGLVRYNASGTQRLAWSNPDSFYTHYQDEYLVYPNSATATISEIQDLRTINNRIYVLVNDQYTASSALTISRILAFNPDGSFISSTIPFSANTYANADTPNYAGGLATYTDLVAGKRYLVVTATRYVPGIGHGRPVFRRYELGASSGDLAASSGMVELNTSACWNVAWECHARAIEANSLYSPNLYVAFAYRSSTATENWNIAVSRINVDGVGDVTWDPNNVSWNISDGGSGKDWPMGLEVRTPPSSGAFRDEIYVLSESARNCQAGVGVLRLDHDGNAIGSRLFGGDTNTGTACEGNSRRFDRPQAIVANASNNANGEARLAIVGYTGISFVVGPPTNATLTVLDAGLATRDSRDFKAPLNTVSNYGERFPALYGVVSDGSGSFTAVGGLNYPSYASTPVDVRGKSTVTTIRFSPDRIFGNDF